jgi:enoyl-CoA hydratase
MAGSVVREATDAHGVARVTLVNDGKRNAIDVAMWRALRSVAASLADDASLRAVIVRGAGGHFAAGADIEEFPRFRFDANTLREYHHGLVAPALQALLDSERPLVAQIDGACIGGGLEVAACCDLRIAARGASFGIPVARLGFPLAPAEAALLRGVVGDAVLRELLLEARLHDADAALQRGLVHRVVDDAQVDAEDAARRIAELPREVAAINKCTLGALRAGTPAPAHAFDYAGAAHHREGIAAFLDKRAARFPP